MRTAVLILFISLALTFSNCGGDDSAESNPDQSNTSFAPASVNHPEGLRLYEENCQSCHQATGLGLKGQFPPLAKSDFLEDKEAVIKQVLYGASGKMIVNEEAYYGVMTPFNFLSDQEISQILNFVYNSWGNGPTSDITPKVVKSQR